jgi:hypothetical protein
MKSSQLFIVNRQRVVRDEGRQWCSRVWRSDVSRIPSRPEYNGAGNEEQMDFLYDSQKKRINK